MEEQDKKEFAVVMKAMESVYKIDLSKITLKIWFDVLRDLSIEEVTQAVMSYLRSPDTGSYTPKPADIIRMVNGTAQDCAMIAWTAVDQAVRMVGTHKSVIFPDPIIHRVIEDIGGWIGLGEKTEKEWSFLARDFKDRYKAYKAKGVIPSCSKKMIGESDANNNRQGYELEEPVVITIGTDKTTIRITGPDDMKRRAGQEKERLMRE